MKTIDRRLAALEDKEGETGLRHVVMAWGGLPAKLPPGVKEDDPGVLVIRRSIVEAPERDAQGQVIGGPRPWDDSDPRYLEFASRERAEASRLSLAVAGARDTLAVKLAAMDRGTEPGVTP